MKRALTFLSLMLTVLGCAGPQKLLPSGEDPKAVAAQVAQAGNNDPTLPMTDYTHASDASPQTGSPPPKPTPVLDSIIDNGSEVLHGVVVAGTVVLVVGLIASVVVLYFLAAGHEMP